MRRGGRIGAGAILALVAFAAASSAWGLKVRSAVDSTVDPNGNLKATARCNGDERVVSGGFSLPGEGQVTVSRAARGQGWTATSDGSVPLSVFAYCGGRGISRHSESETVPGADSIQRTVAARCDRDESLVSGGYQTVDAEPGVHDLIPFKSRRGGDRTWKVTVFNDAFDSATLKVFAYCRRNVDVKARSRQSDPIPQNGDGSATARCQQGEELLSGGYTTTPKSDYENTTGPDFFYTSSFRSDRRKWTAAAHNYSSFEDGRITTFAYCRA